MSSLCCLPLIKEGDGSLRERQRPKPSKQQCIHTTESDASLDEEQTYGGNQVCTRSVVDNKST